ncbi:YAP1 [Acanthosepion pharaonis]|uniref:YAP1 n=1 Tax=Acanthosepion pharaonis TaxID=158019 RepID=A0A812BAR6_ACAPH|nr:YAP1 [Sepia pharaonis]
MNPTEAPPQIPLRMRNLPASFFKPPDPTQQKPHSGSREGSTESTTTGPGGTGGGTSGLTIAHPRAHSSPASLTQTLSAAPPPSSQHVRQHSYDLTDEQPLPPGWEMAKTTQGHRYYLNHLDQSTTWHDPRKSHSTSVLNSQQPNRPQSQQSPPAQIQNIGPLPPGWEQATTNEGEVYFINHVERTTSWYDPRIRKSHQKLFHSFSLPTPVFRFLPLPFPTPDVFRFLPLPFPTPAVFRFLPLPFPTPAVFRFLPLPFPTPAVFRFLPLPFPTLLYSAFSLFPSPPLLYSAFSLFPSPHPCCIPLSPSSLPHPCCIPLSPLPFPTPAVFPPNTHTHSLSYKFGRSSVALDNHLFPS